MTDFSSLCYRTARQSIVLVVFALVALALVACAAEPTPTPDPDPVQATFTAFDTGDAPRNLRVSDGSTANTFDLLFGSGAEEFTVGVQQDDADITFKVVLSANSGITAHGTEANRYVIGTVAQDAAITITAAGVRYMYNVSKASISDRLYSAKVEVAGADGAFTEVAYAATGELSPLLNNPGTVSGLNLGYTLKVANTVTQVRITPIPSDPANVIEGPSLTKGVSSGEQVMGVAEEIAMLVGINTTAERKSYVLNVDFEGNSTNIFVFATRNSVSPDEAAAAYYEYSIVQKPTVTFNAFSSDKQDTPNRNLRVSNGSTANTFELVLGSVVVEFEVNVQQNGLDIDFTVIPGDSSGIVDAGMGKINTRAKRYSIVNLPDGATITVEAAGVSYVYNVSKLRQGTQTLYSAKVEVAGADDAFTEVAYAATGDLSPLLRTPGTVSGLNRGYTLNVANTVERVRITPIPSDPDNEIVNLIFRKGISSSGDELTMTGNEEAAVLAAVGIIQKTNTRNSYVLTLDFEGSSTNTFVFAIINAHSNVFTQYYEYSIERK